MTMKSVDLPHLRSVVLAGHAGSGKTTLAEQLLFRAGAIPRLGRVDDGTAHLDFEPEEQKRRESLSLAVGTFESDGTRISLVDTPGYPDFIADVIEGFAAADGAIFVMDASARRRGRPGARGRARARDRDRRLLLHQQERPRERRTRRRPSTRCGASFGNKIAPLQIAIGAAESFEGYVDLVHRKAWRLRRHDRGRGPDPRRPRRRGGDPPRPAARGRRRGRRRRPDQVPRGRGDLRPGARGLPAQGRQGIDPGAGPRRQRGSRASGCAACSTRSSATSPPRPTRPPTKATDKCGATVEVAADESGPLLVRVFKTTADPFVGRLTYLRVLSGTLHSQAHVWNSDAQRGRADRPAAAAPRQGAGADRRAQGGRDRGGRQADRDRDRRHARSREKPLVLPPLDFPEPSLMVAIEPQSKGDLDKMGPALARMLEEEPTVRLERAATGEQVLRTMGEAHNAVIIERLKRKFGAAIVTHTPQGPVQGDDPRQDPGPRPLQEADRRARDVRRRLAGARAEPRRRRRVRRARRRRRRARRASSPASRRASARRPRAA